MAAFLLTLLEPAEAASPDHTESLPRFRTYRAMPLNSAHMEFVAANARVRRPAFAPFPATTRD
ncbi:hypothetical protein CKA34_29995 (plasmid) [Rhizobium sp. 11515TR]|nr:hypothetical protein CKA34_29995 [Rhizobium sp. 11515TR]